MKNYVWRPSPLLNEDGKESVESFQGHVKIKVLSQPQSMQLCKEYGLKISMKGEVSINDFKDDYLEFASKLFDIAKAIAEEVVLWRMIDGEKLEYNCLEDLSYDQDGRAIIAELGSIGMNGAKLGKNLRTK